MDNIYIIRYKEKMKVGVRYLPTMKDVWLIRKMYGYMHNICLIRKKAIRNKEVKNDWALI